MTPLQRVLTTLGHQEPDRVPLFLLLTLHGAKEVGLPIREYFSSARNVLEGQLRLRAKYGSDCIYSFFYAALEVEAWGGEVLFFDDGPPNAGQPVLKHADAILSLEPPNIENAPGLLRVLECERLLHESVAGVAPIIGVVMSPFSLPVMQLGFDKYLDVMYERPEVLTRLLQVNEHFCVEWANAQLRAGATAICYFDPVSSCTIVPKDLYVKWGLPVAQRTLSRIQGPTATHLASGRGLPIAEYLAQTGTAAVGVSCDEDLSQWKEACRGRVSILGNLNGIEMRHWTARQAEVAVKNAIAKAGPGGGFILSDAHGEIPWQVPDQVLSSIAEAADKWGKYPLDWVPDYELETPHSRVPVPPA